MFYIFSKCTMCEKPIVGKRINSAFCSEECMKSAKQFLKRGFKKAPNHQQLFYDQLRKDYRTSAHNSFEKGRSILTSELYKPDDKMDIPTMLKYVYGLDENQVLHALSNFNFVQSSDSNVFATAKYPLATPYNAILTNNHQTVSVG